MKSVSYRSVTQPSVRSTLRASTVLLAAMASLTISISNATTFIKADNATALNLAGSYTPNSGVPGVADIIEVDATLTTTRTSSLGDNLSVQGINQTVDSDFQLQISNTAGKVLTIGSGGVTKGSTIAGANLIFANAVTLGANQTWSITAPSSGNANLQMNGAFSDGGYTLAVTGTGTFDLRGSNTFGANVTIDTTVSINNLGSTVVFGGNNTFNTLAIPSGRLQIATIGNFGVASNAGDGGTNTAITLGNTTDGFLEYTGTTASTNRTITRDGRSAASGIDVTTSGQTLTISGALGSGSQVNAFSNGWVFGGAGNLILNGIINNSSGVGSTGTTLTKTGAGTLTLGAANTFTGETFIRGGTLTIGASERIVNTNALTLDGGIFNVATFTETLGTLDLTIAGGTLNIGSGGKLIFSDSSALDWNGGLLSVTGSFASGSSIKFGSSAGTLTGTQLSSISIAGFNNVALDSSGFLTASAIPEPSAYAALAGVGMLCFSTLRRRRQGA